MLYSSINSFVVRNCRFFHTFEKNILVTVKNWWSLAYGHMYIYSDMNQRLKEKRILSKYDKNNCHLSCILNLVIMLARDIQTNPGPQHRNRTVNPCGLCERPVTWSCEVVCCDECNIWYHRSCIELCAYDYELLQRSSEHWMCCKCESMNVDSFAYHSFELYASNMFSPLSRSNITIASDINTSVFCPVHTSSLDIPKRNRGDKTNPNTSTIHSTESTSFNVLNIPP